MSGYWTATGGGQWSNAANWDGAVPNGTAVTFGEFSTPTSLAVVGTGYGNGWTGSVTDMAFVAGGNGWRFTNAGTLNFLNGYIANIYNGDTVTMDGAVTGFDVSLMKCSYRQNVGLPSTLVAGTLILNGVNSFTYLRVYSQTVVIGSDFALTASGKVMLYREVTPPPRDTLDSGEAKLDANGARTVRSTVEVHNGFTFLGTGGTLDLAGEVILYAPTTYLTVSSAANPLTISGPVTSSAVVGYPLYCCIKKDGAGTLCMTNPGSSYDGVDTAYYTSGNFVLEGVLKAGHANAIPGRISVAAAGTLQTATSTGGKLTMTGPLLVQGGTIQIGG